MHQSAVPLQESAALGSKAAAHDLRRGFPLEPLRCPDRTGAEEPSRLSTRVALAVTPAGGGARRSAGVAGRVALVQTASPSKRPYMVDSPAFAGRDPLRHLSGSRGSRPRCHLSSAGRSREPFVSDLQSDVIAFDGQGRLRSQPFRR